MSSLRVAITVGQNFDTPKPYRAVLEAVGLDVTVLSSVDVTTQHAAAATRALEGFHGIVMAGGGDIDPDLQGGEAAHHPTVYGVDRNRDDWERAVFDEAWRRDMPVFAICRGMQLMNWALGGTLCADIDDLHAPRGVEKRHRQTDYGYARADATHDIVIAPRTQLHRLLGEARITVNSIHHQAVLVPAPGLVVTARSDDGVIEAFEHPERVFGLGVQFHPEDMWRQNEAFKRLFSGFGEAVSAFAQRT